MNAARPLDGLKVLVTGGSRGVGAAIVRRLVAEGAFPIIHYSSSMSHAESLLREIGGRGVLVRGDLSEEKAAERVWAEAVKATGRIDALVNNAGMRTEIAIDADMDDWRAAWRKEFQVNLFSAMDLSALAIRHFREIGGGRIINVSSVTAHRGYSGDTIAYGATKAALSNATKTIARNFAAEKIYSMAIAPGWISTEMGIAAAPSYGGEEAVLRGIPTGRMASPEEIAEMVAFTLRPSQIAMTGSTLDANSGTYAR